MDNFDLINGTFELIGAITIIFNIRKLYIDKCVKGIHWGSVVFFTTWGLWNLGFYPHLGQWYSFLGGMLLTLANTYWLGLLWYYHRKVRIVDESPWNK